LSESEGNRLVVVTFKCSGEFKAKMDKFTYLFDSRSDMIRRAVSWLMLERGFEE